MPNKTVLITGASRGIGTGNRACICARAGYQVAANTIKATNRRCPSVLKSGPSAASAKPFRRTFLAARRFLSW